MQILDFMTLDVSWLAVAILLIAFIGRHVLAVLETEEQRSNRVEGAAAGQPYLLG